MNDLNQLGDVHRSKGNGNDKGWKKRIEKRDESETVGQDPTWGMGYEESMGYDF